MLLADRLRYVTLEGTEISNGEAGIRHYSVHRALLNGDLPDED